MSEPQAHSGARPFLGYWLPLQVAYAVPLLWVVEHWFREGTEYGHGPLVVIVGAVVLWSRRKGLAALPGRWDRSGWWLLGPGLLFHLVGALLLVDSLSAASIVLSLPGAVWLQQGRVRAKALWPVLLLPLLALPMPFHLLQEVTFRLKELATSGALMLTNALGLAVERKGAYVSVPGQTGLLEVADACGGLRSLLALTTVGYCVAFFMGRQTGARRWVVLAVSGPVAVVSNILRITGMFLVADGYGVAFLAETGHDLLNVAEWVFALGMLFAVDQLLSRGGPAQDRSPAKHPPADGAAGHPNPSTQQPDPHLPRVAALCFWVGACGVLVLGLIRPVGSGTQRAAQLPAVVGPWELVQDLPLTPRQQELLGTDDAVLRRYGSGGHSLWVTAVFHETNWKSVHPPRICLEGSNMSTRSVGSVELAQGSGGLLVMNRLGASGAPGDARSYVSVFAYGAADMVTGSYSSFVWHHVPRALLRASTAGFLLRVEGAPVPGESVDQVRERARALLELLVVESRDILERGTR